MLNKLQARYSGNMYLLQFGLKYGNKYSPKFPNIILCVLAKLTWVSTACIMLFYI